MKILITNDDGIDSIGIRTLVHEFSKDHNNEILVVAPDSQRSATGHSITLNRPIVVREQKLDGLRCKAYSTDGTPADCVKLGVEKLHLETGKVELVVSGINHGTNLGSDVIYSGTVSAAIEGAVCRIPSFAVSLDVLGAGYDYKGAAHYARRIVSLAMEQGIDSSIVLNINVPALPMDQIKGIRVSELGNRIYQNSYLETTLDDCSFGYRVTGFPKDEEVPCTDTYDMKQGYVTVTPLHYDLTNYSLLEKVGNWFKRGV